MNIARLTVMSLRVCTSWLTPRWSVNVSSLSWVFRYRSWVLMLNLRRKGTLASAGVSQMIIPSLYRSFGGSVVPDAGCAEAAVANDVNVDVSATATESLMNERRKVPRRTRSQSSSSEEPIDQQSVTDCARPASLVSLY